MLSEPDFLKLHSDLAGRIDRLRKAEDELRKERSQLAWELERFALELLQGEPEAWKKSAWTRIAFRAYELGKAPGAAEPADVIKYRSRRKGVA